MMGRGRLSLEGGGGGGGSSLAPPLGVAFSPGNRFCPPPPPSNRFVPVRNCLPHTHTHTHTSHGGAKEIQVGSLSTDDTQS